jgi:hypothetical protein
VLVAVLLSRGGRLIDTNASVWEKAAPRVHKLCDSFASCAVQWRLKFHGDSQSEPQQDWESFGDDTQSIISAQATRIVPLVFVRFLDAIRDNTS